MKIMKPLRNKKGFTLIEIIVVLVILAILAAFSIPSMIGFVDDARSKAYVAEARTAYLAAQAVVTEAAVTAGGSSITTAAELMASSRFTTMVGTDISGTVIDIDIVNGSVKGLVYSVVSGGTTYYVKLVPPAAAETQKNGTAPSVP